MSKANLPTISVITPSFNQARYLPDCLESVLYQSYQPIEHIVLDPGSTDGSRDIASGYAHVTLVAEPDDGQGDAVNKGIQASKGDIIAWLNSDDAYYSADVLERVAREFTPEDQFLYGKGVFVDASKQWLRDAYVNSKPETLSARLQEECGILQPAVFFSRKAYEANGPISKFLEFCMDYEYWIRAVKAEMRFRFLDQYFAKAHFHAENKTFGQRGKSYEQVCAMLFEQFGYVHHKWLMRYAEFLTEEFDGVLAHSSNTKVSSPRKLQATYLELLRDFNTSADTVHLLSRNSDSNPHSSTLAELKNHRLLPKHYREIPKTDEPPSPNEYDMGERRWQFKARWVKRQIKRTRRFYKRAHSRLQRDTCIILCNGPSLNAVNLGDLHGQHIIGSNNIFLRSEFAELLTYYTVVNYLVAEQSAPHINQLESAFKIIPWWLGYCINPSNKTYYTHAKGFPEFSLDIATNISWRHTVTFYNMQLAYGLGYRKVLLVGCDHSYSQDESLSEAEVVNQTTEDINHFDPRYFLGKQWQIADVDNMEAMYRLAKVAYEDGGREIINCTEGGALELFRRSSLRAELGV